MHRPHVMLRLVRAPLLTAGAALAFVGPPQAGAQEAAHELRAALAECAALTRSRDRLACYDELAGAQAADADGTAAARGSEALGRGPAPNAARAAESAPRATRPAAPETDDHGREPAPQAQAAQPPVELHSSVAALREILPGMLEITLANGQVWRQTGSDRYPLRVGYDVRIYRARFGGEYFRLTAPTLRGFVQVERVR